MRLTVAILLGEGGSRQSEAVMHGHVVSLFRNGVCAGSDLSFLWFPSLCSEGFVAQRYARCINDLARTSMASKK